MSAPAQVPEAHRATAETIFKLAEKAAHNGDPFREPCAQLIADSEGKACHQLRAEVERLKSDGAASAFVNMSCRASRAETERNNLRADLDAIKAILTEEKDRAERAQAELATERARLDWLEFRGPWEAWSEPCGEAEITLRGPIRAAIDAAMKEETK